MPVALRLGGRLSGLAAAALLGMAPTALAEEPVQQPLSDEAAQQWAVRLARMEGASVNVQEAARAVVESSRRISESGRIHGLSDLAADSIELHRRVVSLTLATEVLGEDLQALPQ